MVKKYAHMISGILQPKLVCKLPKGVRNMGGNWIFHKEGKINQFTEIF